MVRDSNKEYNSKKNKIHFFSRKLIIKNKADLQSPGKLLGVQNVGQLRDSISTCGVIVTALQKSNLLHL